MTTKRKAKSIILKAFSIFTVIAPILLLGWYFGKNDTAEKLVELQREISRLTLENKKYADECTDLKKRIKNLIDDITKLKEELKFYGRAPYDVFIYGETNRDLEIQPITGKNLNNWLEPINSAGELCMSYPGGQNWGAVIFTVGKPKPHGQREGIDLSGYKKIVLELKGRGENTTVDVGLKDSTQPDTGSETRQTFALKKEWATYEIDLKKFTGTNLKDLYGVTEFVFGNEPQSMCIREIQFQ